MKLVLDNGKEIKLTEEITSKLQEVIDKETKDTGWCKEDLKTDDNYYVIKSNGGIDLFKQGIQDKYSFDYNCYKNANKFSSKELAEKVAFKQALERKLMRFSDEHEGDKIDKTSYNDPKYNIFYHIKDKELRVGTVYNGLYFGEAYFYSKEIAEQAIEEFKDDLIKYFTIYA